MTHQQARQQLQSGIQPDLICATCPWDRLCIEPPAISEREATQKIDAALKQDEERDPQRGGMPVGMLLTALLYAGKPTAGQLCPVFALRLSGPDGRILADRVRVVMTSWEDPS